MKKISFILAIFIIVLLVNGCTNAVTYDKGNNLKLYYVVPGTTQPLNGYPAIIFIHGYGSTKDTMLNMANAAAKRGYFAITIDLRDPDGENVMWPEPLSDSLNAIAWLINDSSQSLNWSKPNPYKIDANRIGAVGYSAGGLYSLWLGNSEYINAVISLAGPTNLDTMYRYHAFKEKEDVRDPNPLLSDDNICIEFLTFLVGPYFRIDVDNDGILDYDPEYLMASPIHLPATEVPILLVYGSKDNYVPPSQPRNLMIKIRNMGGVCDLFIFNWGHFLDPGVSGPVCPAIEMNINSGIKYKNSSGYTSLDIMFEFLDAFLQT